MMTGNIGMNRSAQPWKHSGLNENEVTNRADLPFKSCHSVSARKGRHFQRKADSKKRKGLTNTLTICHFKATLIREKKKNTFTISNSYKRSRCAPTLERRHVNPTPSSACPYPSVVLTLEICAMTATESREMSRSPLLSTWTNHNYRKVVRQTGFCFLLTRTSLMYWCNFDVD